MKIGENIRSIRTTKNITQEQLAETTGIKQSIISRYENGTIIPPIPKLEIISQALEIPINQLIAETQKEVV